MKPQSLPAGTPVTIELRGKGKSEYVDGTIVGAQGRKIVVRTFDGHVTRVDPDCVWRDPEDPPAEAEETPLIGVLQHTPWPEFPPTVKPAAIR